MNKTNRRTFIGRGVTVAAAAAAAAVPVAAQEKPVKKVHYAGMNEMFQGRFGSEPPVRTTIAAPGGIPGNSLVEIDVIAVI